MNYSTDNCSILQQNIVVYHKKKSFTTKCDTLPQSSNSIGYTITNSSILLQSYHKI